MTRPRNPRLLPACLALAMLSGCFGAPTTPVTPATSKRPGTSSTPGTPAAGTPPPASLASTGPSGMLPSIMPAATLPPPPVNAVSGKPVIQGVVRIPVKIIGNNGGNIIGQNGANLISDHGGGVIGQNGASVIGQNGASVIGQNGASVIGQNGASVIGQNGASIIGNNGAGVIGQNGASFKFTQYRVAKAKVVVKDAAGQPIKDAAGKPVETTSDETGAYELPAGVVPSNAIIEVTSPDLAGNTLAAYLPSDAAMVGAAIDVDIASTLVINYVRDQYVKGDQALLDKLPRTLAEEARIDLAAALEETDFAEVKVVAAAEVEKVVAEAIASSAEVSEVFARIKDVYVFAGIRKQGDGQPAIGTPIGDVSGILRVADQTYFMSSFAHTLYSVGSDGLLRVETGIGKWAYPEQRFDDWEYDAHTGMAFKDGEILVCDQMYHRVVAVKDGTTRAYFGSGKKGKSPVGTAAADFDLSSPSGLACLPSGEVLVADRDNNRVLRLDKDGAVSLFSGSGESGDDSVGMAAGDVALYRPQGVLVKANGQVVVCDYLADRVLTYTRLETGDWILDRIDKVLSPIDAAELGGSIWVASCKSSGLYELKDSASRMDLTAFSRNGVGANFHLPRVIEATGDKLLIDGKGGQVTSMSPAAKTIELMAGEPTGFIPSQQFTSARTFDYSPTYGIAVADMNENRIFFVDAKGTVSFLAGNGQSPRTLDDISGAALDVRIGPVSDVKWGPAGELYFSAGGDRPYIGELNKGQIRRLVGKGPGSYDKFKPGPALEVALAYPESIGFGPEGKLLIHEPSAHRMLVLLEDGTVKQSDAWGVMNGTVGWRRDGDGRYLAIDWLNQKIVAFKDGTRTTLGAFSELPGLNEPRDVHMAIYSPEGDLYVACYKAVYRKRHNGTAFELFCGEGGLLFNGTTRDETLTTLRSLAFTKEGDLLLLEGNQLKVVSKSSLL